jgi:hypothetical protein
MYTVTEKQAFYVYGFLFSLFHMFICVDILAYLGLGLAQVGPIAEARVHSGESGMEGRFVLTIFFFLR